MVCAELLGSGFFKQPISKIVCVGRNYAEHAKEFNNPIPSSPILFIKPESSVQALVPGFKVPKSGIQYETEVAILIGEPLSKASQSQSSSAISAIGLALDLTDRVVQAELKSKGLPWERSKAFDGACVLSPFVPYSGDGKDFSLLNFYLDIDGVRAQSGACSDMLSSIPALLAEISHSFSLRAGDVVLTGTPAGVGELKDGVELKLGLKAFAGLGDKDIAFNASVSVLS